VLKLEAEDPLITHQEVMEALVVMAVVDTTHTKKSVIILTKSTKKNL
jgi:hypothetical protein